MESGDYSNADGETVSEATPSQATSEISKSTRQSKRNGGSARQTELLEIAAQMFAARGYFATTVRDLAEEAGIFSGSLYHHFESKEALVDVILREFLDGVLAGYRQIVSEGRPPRKTLENLVRASLMTMSEHRAAIIIYQNEAGHFAEFPRFKYLQEMALEMREIWISVLTAGVSCGDFRTTIDAELVYRYIRDTVWSAPRWFSPKESMTLEGLAAEYTTVVLDGIALRRS